MKCHFCTAPQKGKRRNYTFCLKLDTGALRLWSILWQMGLTQLWSIKFNEKHWKPHFLVPVLVQLPLFKMYNAIDSKSGKAFGIPELSKDLYVYNNWINLPISSWVSESFCKWIPVNLQSCYLQKIHTQNTFSLVTQSL